jgi:hypothetical protein
MKPTTDHITASIRGVRGIRDCATDAHTALYAALQLFIADAPGRAGCELNVARQSLITLRRSQTTALANIDEALASMDKP